jgi:hypothetical protein
MLFALPMCIPRPVPVAGLVAGDRWYLAMSGTSLVN